MFNKRFAGLVLMGAALTASSAAFAAGDRDFNTAAGAVLGAAIGSQNGGTGGAVVGGLVGAAVGNAVSGGHGRGRGYSDTRVYVNAGQPSYYYQPAPAPVYYEPAPVYVRPAPVYVAPAPVYRERYYYAPAPRYYYHDRGYHHGHRR